MITDREIYQLFHNKTWIEGLDGQEIAHFDVDNLENQWMLYKPKFTTVSTHPDRLKTQKNRKGDLLLRKKNKPFGFKVTDSTETDISGAGRKYQANVPNQTLREIMDGNVYDFKLYGNYGIVFGSASAGDFYVVCFQIDGIVKNPADEEFVSISVVTSQSVDSLNAYVDAIIYNGNFYSIVSNGSTLLTTTKYNISFGVTEGSVSYTFATDQFTGTSENDLSGLSYTPVTSRLIPINGVPTETIGRIWTTSYSDSSIFLAYECNVPVERSSVTSVTEGIALLAVSLDGFLESSTATISYYVYDSIEDIAKVTDDDFCQCFIPDYTDEQQSFGHSITLDGDNLIVGSPEEDAIYVFDLADTITPDLFGSPPTTLATNGTKIDKNYALEHTPVFPVRLSGNMDFIIYGTDAEILWRYPDGSLSTNPQASGFLASSDVYYLFCDDFENPNVSIDAKTTAGFHGSLNDIPSIGHGIYVNDTMASGHFGDNFQGIDINIENTNVNQADLERNAIVLDEAGNITGTLTAKEGLPAIVTNPGIAAINALIAKGWNVSVNMAFDDIDPQLTLNGYPVSGVIDTFATLEEDPFAITGIPTSGAIEWIVPDQLIVNGSGTPAVDGTYDINGEQNSKPKWTKDSTPFNDIEFNTQWDIMHETPVSGAYYTHTGTDYLPDDTGWSAGDVGIAPAPTISKVYN
jgi:hypothetical protein